LSNDEIAVVDAYYRKHQVELDAADDRVNACRDKAILEQRERLSYPTVRVIRRGITFSHSASPTMAQTL
jgi:hypothetical protein